MNAVSTVEMARVVEPNTRVSPRVQTISKIRPEAPDRKKQASTTARMKAGLLARPGALSGAVHLSELRGCYSQPFMRYGILSDTHANIEALEAVFKAFESEGIDRYVCLGDTVGYGASPNEACALMRSKVAFAILGNHDAAVAGRMDYSYYYYAARHALDRHAQILDKDNMAWLKELPYEVREHEVLFCHGSPLNVQEFDYIFARDQ